MALTPPPGRAPFRYAGDQPMPLVVPAPLVEGFQAAMPRTWIEPGPSVHPIGRLYTMDDCVTEEASAMSPLQRGQTP